MLLQGYFTLGHFCEVSKGLVPEFTTGDHFVPFVAAYLSVKSLDAVEPEGEMTFVLNEPDLVPFAYGMGFGNRSVSRHIIETAGEVVLFFVVVCVDIIQYLHFWSGKIGVAVFRVFLDVKNDPAVAAF